MNLHKLAFAAAMIFGVEANADISFSSLDPAMPELPKTIQFDCALQSEEERLTVTALDRDLIVPRHFSQSETDENWFIWNAQLHLDEESIIYPYVTLSFGEYGSEISWFEDWEFVSDPSSNHLGVEIRYKEMDPSKEYDRYELLLFRDGRFLKSTSVVPVDWVSLLNCFE